MKSSLFIRVSGACGRSEMVAARCMLALVFSSFPVVTSGLRAVRYHDWANQIALGFHAGRLEPGTISESLLRLNLADGAICMFTLQTHGHRVALFTLRTPLLTRWTALTARSTTHPHQLHLHLRHKLP